MKTILPALRRFQEVCRECKAEAKIAPTAELKEISLVSLFKEDNKAFQLDLANYVATKRKKNIPMYITETEVIKLKRYFEANSNKDLGEKMYNFVMGRVLLDE